MGITSNSAVSANQSQRSLRHRPLLSALRDAARFQAHQDKHQLERVVVRLRVRATLPKHPLEQCKAHRKMGFQPPWGVIHPMGGVSASHGIPNGVHHDRRSRRLRYRGNCCLQDWICVCFGRHDFLINKSPIHGFCRVWVIGLLGSHPAALSVFLSRGTFKPAGCQQTHKCHA